MKSFFRKIYLCVSIFLMFFYCFAESIEEDNYQQNLSCLETDNTIPFTLDYPDSEEKPVIKLIINNTEYFFMCDTGSSFCVLSKNGVQKLFGTLDAFYNDTLPSYVQYKMSKDIDLSKKNKKQLIKMFDTDILTGKISVSKEFSINKANKQIKWELVLQTKNLNPDTKVDGILGQSFFKQFKNITFDYKEKKIIFDDKKICEKDISMEIDVFGIYRIPFIMDGKQEYGWIDTGNNHFVVRNDIDKEQVLLSDDEMLKLAYNTKGKKTLSKVFTVKEIQIGKVIFNNIEAVNASNIFVKTNSFARNILSVMNSLGYPFFKDNIIQLDFENNVFRIKDL